MRMMLKIVIPTETGNQAIKDGSLHKIFEATMSKLKPEAAYFVAFLERLTNTALCFDIFQFPFRFSTGTNGENVEMRLDL